MGYVDIQVPVTPEDKSQLEYIKKAVVLAMHPAKYQLKQQEINLIAGAFLYKVDWRLLTDSRFSPWLHSSIQTYQEYPTLTGIEVILNHYSELFEE